MKFLKLFSSALALGLAEGYLVAPPGTPAPGATQECSEWVQDSYGLTCDIIQRVYGMSEAQFVAWNPSVASLGNGCNMIQGLYYCVQVNYDSLTTTLPASTSTLTKTSSMVTSTRVGISTPAPTQPGMVSDCNKFHQVASGDTCYNIAAAQGISLDNFYSWNPAVGSTCGGLWAGYYVCVGVSSGNTMTSTAIATSTKTSGNNGIATPTPIQAGMTGNCDAFHLVVSGDGCYNIAATAGISLTDFYAWNPAVGNTCTSLWAGYYVCIGTSGSATIPPPPTTTAHGNGVVTPTPTQAGMVGNCDTFHSVVGGDTCYNIAATAGVSLNTFYSWNPAVGNNCASLWAGYYVCIGLL